MAVFRAPITPGMRWAAGTGTATPAAGYLLFQYLAGGATPQATYTDAGGLTANANPIVLDANGGLEAAGPGGTAIDIWFTGGVAYRLLLTDASVAPLPGNPVWDKDNLVGVDDPAFASPNTGEWIIGGAATFISSAASAAGTVFSMVGDTRALFQPNRRVRLVSANGDLPGTVTRSTFAANLTTITVDMQRTAAGAYPTVANPITALYYALENSGASGGLPAGIPSRAMELGFPRYPADGSARTGIDLYGPIGSNLVAFLSPPYVSAEVTSFNTATGLITWNVSTDKLRSGDAVQWSAGTAPGNLALATTYIYFRVNATTGYFYLPPAGWLFEALPFIPPAAGGSGAGTGGNDGTGGNLAWAGPAGTGSAATGAGSTCTPGFVAPLGVTRVWQDVTGAQGGGGGSRGSTGDGGTGGTGGNSTFNGYTGPGGSGGVGGTAAKGGVTGTPGAIGTGGQINRAGSRGVIGEFNAAGVSTGGGGGAQRWGAEGPINNSGNGGNSTAANQGAGGGGSSGGFAVGFASVTPATFLPAVVGAGGAAGVAGTGTNSAAGQLGSAGIVIVQW